MTKKPTLSTHELEAVQAWAKIHGLKWKIKLHTAWYTGNYNGFERYGILQSIRNNPAFGPEWLVAFKLPKADDELETLRDQMERSRCSECQCSGNKHFEGCSKNR